MFKSGDKVVVAAVYNWQTEGMFGYREGEIIKIITVFQQAVWAGTDKPGKKRFNCYWEHKQLVPINIYNSKLYRLLNGDCET